MVNSRHIARVRILIYNYGLEVCFRMNPSIKFMRRLTEETSKDKILKRFPVSGFLCERRK